ncbi:MAG: DoxX family protein [Reichenbachiella sp.]|uniref:DoxX family protein n=1 Tax=Reichenbachiella sp. TaxID=2184521 RepID=UPI002965FF29|nr:DoxX family protein [Reichenbachiella sp.]MDW3210623.1 DoxX family protein [Reichenbachiella sp.]
MMMNKILITESNWGVLAARLTLGIVLFPHGAQKMLGLFGGYGFTGTMDAFTNQMHLPWIVALAVIMIEFFGSISLLLGFASRLWSLAIAGLFIGIIFTTHLEHGFFMNWFGNQAGEGYEYALLVIGIAVAVLINGSGKYAIDTQLVKLLNK